jgi:predicted methyltransferase
MWNGVAILEIDGIRMHLVRDFKTPLDYAKKVVAELRMTRNQKPGTGNWSLGTVLDTCMGLGYTALEAAQYADRVTTCEISDAVYTLASWNPWSEELFDNKKVQIIRGNLANEIVKMEDNAFDTIVHDPPRFSKAKELYMQLYRICKPNARVFHYVGSVGKQQKDRKIENEVAKRLMEVGFKRIRIRPLLQGLIFEK